MTRHVACMLLLLVASAANAQTSSNNGNGNQGLVNGNGNGNSAPFTQNLSASSANNTINLRSRRETPSVYAPGLAAAGIESCLGSASVGGAAAGIGVTIGGTYNDRGCTLRLYARSLFAMGHKVAAIQLLCNDPDVAQALAIEGVRCVVGPTSQLQAMESASSAPAPAPVTCKHYDFIGGCRND